jgi:hypothetical protein
VRQAGWLLGPAGLTAKASTFTRRDALRGWCEQLRHGADVTEVERLADRLLDPAEPGTIRLTGTDAPVTRLADATGIRLADGRLVHLGTDEPRYTTPELLALEQQLVDTATRLTGAGRAVVDEQTVDDGPGAAGDADRRTAPRRRPADPLRARRRGAGRPGRDRQDLHPRRRLRRLAQAGIDVVGCALAARAALELQTGSGIPSSTIDRLLAELARPGGGLPPGGVLVVDEAGMVGTRTLARLLDATQQTGTKLVLVGDHHQLPEIDAGGAFAGLVTRLPAIELTDNRRQQHRWEIAALDELRDGDLPAAVDAYAEHGRLVVADTIDTLREQLVGDWWQATAEHGSTRSWSPPAAPTSTTSTPVPAPAWPPTGSSPAGRSPPPDISSRSATGCCAYATTATSGSSTAPAAPSPPSTTGPGSSPSAVTTRTTWWICRPTTSTPATSPTATPSPPTRPKG